MTAVFARGTHLRRMLVLPMVLALGSPLAIARDGAQGDAGGKSDGLELLEARRIWGRAPHNAFTDLVRHDGRLWCAFREGARHVSPDGALRVIVSGDAGKTWESDVRIEHEEADLRDAKLSVTPGGELLLYGAAAYHEPDPARHRTLLWRRGEDGAWGEAVPIGEADFWLWRFTWHPRERAAYGIGYATRPPRKVRLYRGVTAGRLRPIVDDLEVPGYPNESSIVFLEDDTALCLLRRDPDPGLVGRAEPPYVEWSWTPCGRRIGGPCLVRTRAGLVAGVRLYDGDTRTALGRLDPGTGELAESLVLPSGGDTSYPGFVVEGDRLRVSWYTSHEGRTEVWLGTVRLPAGDGAGDAENARADRTEGEGRTAR